ncbi:SDR family oxidoreductase [bacterium]|jgi:3-oxoacyl-[acyl-carrier protein] reductase|nr:SDR family oxidoreductase [bacterium]
MLLKNKCAVVTGSNRGIGKAILEVLAQNGADLWACARRESEEFLSFISGLEKKYGVIIKPVYFDISDIESVKKGVREITINKDPIDILVNNAGSISISLFQMTPISKVKEMFDVNFYPMFQLTQMLVKSMLKGGGSIINLSSSAAIEGNEGRVSYASSKAAVITFSQVISRELGRNNVRVNTIAPGLTETDMMRGSTPDDVLEKTLDRISLRRTAKPEEIANVVLFLSSNLSSYITGQVLRVDGGM